MPGGPMLTPVITGRGRYDGALYAERPSPWSDSRSVRRKVVDMDPSERATIHAGFDALRLELTQLQTRSAELSRLSAETRQRAAETRAALGEIRQLSSNLRYSYRPVPPRGGDWD